MFRSIGKKTKNLPTILDWTFFYIESEEDSKIEAVCNECDEKKKGSTSSTGNFLAHYKKKHPTKLAELKEYLKSGNVKANNSRQMVLEEVLHKVQQVNEYIHTYTIAIEIIKLMYFVSNSIV